MNNRGYERYSQEINSRLKIDERGDNCTIHHRCCSSIGKTFIKLPWSFRLTGTMPNIWYIFYLLLGSNNFEQSHICSRNNYLPNRSMSGYGYSTKPTEIFECTYATILNDHNENEVWILWNSSTVDGTKINRTNENPSTTLHCDNYFMKNCKYEQSPLRWNNFY